MSWLPSDLTHIDTNTSNAKIPPLDLTPVGAKIPDPKTLTLPTESSKREEKARKEYVPEDPESDPRSSYSSSKSNSSDDTKYRKSKSKRREKKKKHRKRTLSDSSLSDSDLSGESQYKSKRRNKKNSYQKKKRDPIKLCAKLTAKFLITAFKLKIIKLKCFSYLYRITGNDIFTVQGNLWSTPRLSKNMRGGYKRLC